MARRLQIRTTAKQAIEKYHARELFKRAVSARTRVLENVGVGDVVFFYRDYPSAKAQKLQAQRGRYIGPGLVIGHQGGNIWISFSGRCYLVAREHIRGLAPEEVYTTKPVVRDDLAALKQASLAKDYIDLSDQRPPLEDLAAAAAEPAVHDPEQDVADSDEDKPIEVAPPPAAAEAAVELPPEIES